MKWDLVECWLTMHSLILSNTKLSCLSNDRSYYLNLLDHVLFLQENMRISVNKKGKNRLCFSCDNIEHTYKYVIKIINNHFLWIELFYNFKQSKHIICMKTKIIIVVDLRSVDKIDTRQFLYNRTFVGGSFSMCYWSTCLLIHLK